VEAEYIVKDEIILLHISDIHFREPYCLNLETDQDHPVRVALINDIRKMLPKVGSIDAILTSGDIAFKSNPEEYKVAATWLSKLTEVAGCQKTSVYTVPGNHDVNRENAGYRITQGIRKTIADHDDLIRRDKELYDTLADDNSGLQLIKPIEEYNKFAAAYQCDTSPQYPFWTEELPLTPGWKLKMHGLTTILFSGPNDDKKGDLFLGALQRAFAPEDGIVRLAMMHHPPDWLFDQDQLDDALWNSCALHLMGHKHRQRYHSGANSLRLSAGAVNPSRDEGNWEPGYNIIKLKVIQKKDVEQHVLQIETHLRIWQSSPDRFVAKVNELDENIFIHEILLHNPPSPILGKKIEGIAGPGKNVKEESIKVTAEEAEMVTTSTKRNLVYKFWKLSSSQRRTMMQKLNLLEKEDDQLPETLRYRKAFERARERNMISDLETAIDQIMAP